MSSQPARMPNSTWATVRRKIPDHGAMALSATRPGNNAVARPRFLWATFLSSLFLLICLHLSLNSCEVSDHGLAVFECYLRNLILG